MGTDTGSVFEKRYRIEGVLGEGGMGRVLLARHLELGERVALKLLRTDRALGSDAATRLRREARAAARLHGENVARVMDAGVSEEHGPFLVMEYVSGESLSAVLATEGPLEEKRAVGYVLQAAVALAEAHGLGIVHRDVKPSNLLLTKRPDGSALVKVLDFGIAKAEALAQGTLTDTQNLLGSPKYMSPEQIREARSVDARSDVWSLGVTLYELLTGRLPFEAFTATGVLSRIVTDDPTPMAEVFAGVSPGLEKVVLRMLAKSVDDRFSSVVEAAHALVPFGDDGAAALAERVANVAGTPRVWSQAPALAKADAKLVGDETVTASSRTHDEAAPKAEPQAPARRPLGWILGGAAALVVLGVAFFYGRSGPSPASPSDAASGAAPPVTASAATVTTTVTASAAPSVTALATATPSAAPTTNVAVHAPPVHPVTASATATASAAPIASYDFDFGPRK